jgi:flagellar biosynthesis protein FlhG
MRTIAVTSGKGGVGKTNLSANLGIQLVARGMKTVIFDADLGLANLDVVLGVRAPYTLQNVLSGEKQLKDVHRRRIGRGGSCEPQRCPA